MTHKRYSRWFAGAIALGLVVAACGGDDDDDSAAEPADEAEEPAEEPADEMEEPAEEPADETDEPAEEPADGDMVGLASVCPSPLVIQTDWFPESEHGTLFEMMGDDYTVDVESKIVTGSLVTDGGTVDTGIDWEYRTGGPAIGYSPVSSYVYTDDSIHLAYQNTESQVLAYEDTPMISVLAPLEKNPQIIMWDPETYPEAETLADLGELGVTINVFGGGVFSDVFVAQGIWTADQVDPSYDGSPQRFIAEGGAIAQQGFASAEPYNYEFVFEEWGKPVAYELLHDAGFEVYSQTIAVRPDRFDELSPCLEQVVPIMQQATVDFTESPDRANGIIIDAVDQFADFWVYDEGVAEYSVNTMKELGLKSNGPDDTLGNMEEDRIQGVIDAIRDAGLDVPEDLVASDLFTNEFIDDSIGIPSTTEPASTSTQPTATTAPATTAPATTAPATTAPATTIPEGPFVELAVSSGTSTQFLVTSCVNPGETTIRIEAETINTDATVLMTMDVESGTGSIVLSGAEEAEGTVDQIMVSDTGDITASGTISQAGGSGQDTFDLTGNCA